MNLENVAWVGVRNRSRVSFTLNVNGVAAMLGPEPPDAGHRDRDV